MTTTHIPKTDRQIEHRRRQLARMGPAWRDPFYLAEWTREPRTWWALAYLRTARATSKAAPIALTIGERKARFPSRVRASATLERSLIRIEAGTNEKAARVAAALIAALDSRVSHAKELFGNHFACREREGMISYCPNGRMQEITDDGKWARAGRVEIKPAKWARQILRHPEKFRDDEYAAFAAAFAADEGADALVLTLETTEEGINRGYTSPNWRDYDPDKGTGETHSVRNIPSCMWDSPVGEFYHQAGARLLVAARGEKIVGRALVWETNQGIVLDRIYADTVTRESMQDYAAAQGWLRRVSDSDRHRWVSPDGTESRLSLRVTLVQCVDDVEFYPYADTFRIQEGDELSNIETREYDFAYESTSGNRTEGHAGQVQDHSGDWIDEEDAVFVGGDYYHHDSDEIVHCHRSEEWILRSDAYEVDLGGRIGTVYLHEEYVNRA